MPFVGAVYFHVIVNASVDVASFGAVTTSAGLERGKSEPNHDFEREAICKSPHKTTTMRIMNAIIATTLEKSPELSPPVGVSVIR